VSKSDLRIDWATHAAAKYACENWHYSGTVPSPLTKPFKIGAWESGVFVGAIIYTVGVGATINSAYRIGRQEVCELQRVAMKDHETPITRMISISLAFLKKANPGLRLVVSFADAYHGHHGGIYQGGNWVYAGKTASGVAYFDSTGRQVHPRNVGKVTGYDKVGVKKYCKSKLRQEERPGKHRYLMPLDDEMRKQIEPLRKPYPKRVRSVDSDTTANHAVEGGAIPTRTL
jgi:hypothetical protein